MDNETPTQNPPGACFEQAYHELGAAAKAARFRIVRELTQEEMAEKLGLHVSTVGMIERGTRKPGRQAALSYERVARIDPSEWDEDPSSQGDPS